jgi:hypothetical protein
MLSVILRVLLFLICLVAVAPAQKPQRGSSSGTSASKPAAKDAPKGPPPPDTTAIGALALLPKDFASQVARIEGPDGRPFPERWYVLVHDSSLPRGLREFVFSEGKLFANRGLSQFADTVSAEETFPATQVKVNSDEAAGIAAQFALLNGQQLGGVRYELAKSPAPPVPAWRLTCTAADGQALGTIVLHATKGTLLSYQGFEKSPLQVDVAAASETAPAGGKTAKASTGDTAKSKRSSSSREASSRESEGGLRNPAPVARAVQRTSPPPVREGPVDKVGSFFRKVFH